MKTVKDASELQSNALSISYPLPAIVGCGLWEDLSNGYVTKKPKKKRTSVQIIADSGPDDAGRVRLSINPQHAGPAPRIYLAEDAPVSETSTQLYDQVLTTSALRVNFLMCDPSDRYETGDPVTSDEKSSLLTKRSIESSF